MYHCLCLILEEYFLAEAEHFKLVFALNCFTEYSFCKRLY